MTTKELIDKKIHYERLLVYHSTFMKSISYENISVLTVENRITKVYLNCGLVYTTSRTISELGERLPDSNFFRVNRNYIISYRTISRVEQYFNHRLVIFTNCPHITKVIVSRPRVAAFKDWLGY